METTEQFSIILIVAAEPVQVAEQRVLQNRVAVGVVQVGARRQGADRQREQRADLPAHARPQPGDAEGDEGQHDVEAGLDAE